MFKLELVLALLESAARIAAAPSFGAAQRAMEAAKLQALIVNMRSGNEAQLGNRQNMLFETAKSTGIEKQKKANDAMRAVSDYIRG